MLGIFDRTKDKHAVAWERIQRIMEPFRRTAWLPRISAGPSARTTSKFSGVPVLLKGEQWPCCQHCHQPMQLFLQLNSEDLPIGAGRPFGEGYLQVFYCTNEEQECEIECEAWAPFSKSTLVRVLDRKAVLDESKIPSPVTDEFPEKAIIGWEARADYPDYEERGELGCQLTDEQSDLLTDQEYPMAGDKLLGWPCWIQGVEYPDCPECGERMKLVFQIDSDDHLPFMFGDSGCAHITQCDKHKDQMAIAWASC